MGRGREDHHDRPDPAAGLRLLRPEAVGSQGQEPDQGDRLPASGRDVRLASDDALVPLRDRPRLRWQGSHDGVARGGQDPDALAGRSQTPQDDRRACPERQPVIHRTRRDLHTLIPASPAAELTAVWAVLADPPRPHRSTITTTTKLFLSSLRQHWRTSWK